MRYWGYRGGRLGREFVDVGSGGAMRAKAGSWLQRLDGEWVTGYIILLLLPCGYGHVGLDSLGATQPVVELSIAHSLQAIHTITPSSPQYLSTSFSRSKP